MAVHSVEAKEMTFEEFTRSYAGKRYEYIDGRAVPMGPEIEQDEEVIVLPNKVEHGLLVAEVSTVLGNFMRAKRLGAVFGGETGFLMSEDPRQVRAADVAFVAQDRLKEVQRNDWLPFPPDLAVEVVSEYDTASAMREKARTYIENGTRLLWIVYPKTREVEVWRPDQPMQILTVPATLDDMDVLPGFSLSLETLFSALDALA